MVNKFAVIGLGYFGSSIARSLALRGAEVLAIDKDPEMVEPLKDDVAYAVALDTTDLKTLRAQNIQSMDGVVVAIGENFEGLLLTTVHLLELNVPRVIARAANKHQRMILEKVGVKEILSPEDEVGKTVAETLLHPNMKKFLSLPDDYEIVEVEVPPRAANRTLKSLGLREKYNLNLITIERSYEEAKDGETKEVRHIIGVPKGDTVVYDSDILIIMGKTRDVNKFIEINK